MSRNLAVRHHTWRPQLNPTLRVLPCRALQEPGSTPLKEGHPRHIAGRDDTVDDEGEEANGNAQSEGPGKGAGGNGKGVQGADPADTSGGQGQQQALVGQVEALRQQLEEQGRLLRALADHLDVAP